MDQTDLDAMLNTPHVPEDAGDRADALRRILDRIPERWGRWVSCDSGWYQLIIDLDAELAEIFPDYELHQVKEKFGTLRYYIGFPDLEPDCCTPIQESRPCEGAVDPRGYNVSKDRTLTDQYELTKWFYTVLIPHVESDEHEAGMRALDPERERRQELSEKMHEVINKYENLSARTCELCGAEAEMHTRRYWYKTLCSPCAEKNNYQPIPDEEDED